MLLLLHDATCTTSTSRMRNPSAIFANTLLHRPCCLTPTAKRPPHLWPPGAAAAGACRGAGRCTSAGGAPKLSDCWQQHGWGVVCVGGGGCRKWISLRRDQSGESRCITFADITCGSSASLSCREGLWLAATVAPPTPTRQIQTARSCAHTPCCQVAANKPWKMAATMSNVSET
jgi:hypothetical protein